MLGSGAIADRSRHVSWASNSAEALYTPEIWHARQNTVVQMSRYVPGVSDRRTIRHPQRMPRLDEFVHMQNY